MGITFAQTSVLQGVNSKHIMVRHHFGAESASRQKKKKNSHYEADISVGNKFKSVFHLYTLKNSKVKRARL